MPLSSSVYALIALWQSLRIPDPVIVAALIELLIGQDGSERSSPQQQAEAEAIARAAVGKEASQLLESELAKHVIVQHWAAWARVAKRTRDRFGSLARDQLAEIYKRFCAGELTTDQKINDALDALFAPDPSHARGSIIPPSTLP